MVFWPFANPQFSTPVKLLFSQSRHAVYNESGGSLRFAVSSEQVGLMIQTKEDRKSCHLLLAENRS